jgi:uncharacterized alpha-E superfamily protein
MMSRVASSIYWMSRYIERAENVARFVDVNLHLLLDLPQETRTQWGALVATTGDDEAFRERYGEPVMENVLRFLTFDLENPNSILSSLRAARENARSVREYITSEMWLQLNQFYFIVKGASSDGGEIQSPHDFYLDVMMASHRFLGITDATMSHGEGWHFCRMGRMLERADKTSRILDVKYYLLLPSVSYVGTPYDDLHWAALLRSASAFEMYRKRHGRITPENVARFLLIDPDFPRSIYHCLKKAEESLRAITGTPPGRFPLPIEQRFGRLIVEMETHGIRQIIESGLHEFIDGIQIRINEAGAAIHDTFFAMKPMAPTLSSEGDQ